MIKLVEVTNENKQLAKELQAEIFYDEKSPEQIERGLRTKNPSNYICYNDKNKPIGIVGFYFQDNLPEHALLNWYGVLTNERKKGYGKEILLSAIDLCKKNYPDRKYFTYYTDKYENIPAINLYQLVGFVTKDYCCKEDIEKMNEVGMKNTFVVGVFPLKNNLKIEFEKIDMQIPKKYAEINLFNEIHR